MNIMSSDEQYSIPLGGSATWKVLCSTIQYHLLSKAERIPHVIKFLKSNHISSDECLETAKEFNLVRDYLSQISPDRIVYDDSDPSLLPPWGKNISPVITSCANYLTTGDGDDLLAEIVKILTYAAYAKVSVDVE